MAYKDKMGLNCFRAINILYNIESPKLILSLLLLNEILINLKFINAWSNFIDNEAKIIYRKN